MRLSPEEYSQGLVRWSGQVPATVRLISSISSEDHPPSSSEELIDSDGSVPNIVPDPPGQIVLSPADPSFFALPFWVSWDRLVGDEIETVILHHEVGAGYLTGIPSLSTFQRLIVSTPYLRWEEDAVLRVDDVIVRFTDRIVALRQDEFSETHEAARSEFVVGAAEHVLRGRFVEIVAPEKMGKDRDSSLSILGLLATVLGDGVVGDVVRLDTLEPAPQGGRAGWAGCARRGRCRGWPGARRAGRR